MKTKKNTPAMIMILDGFGENPSPYGNAILAADTPNLDALKAKYPHKTLEASGPAVGLPEGQMGNSEVGHMNIGAGIFLKFQTALMTIASKQMKKY